MEAWLRISSCGVASRRRFPSRTVALRSQKRGYGPCLKFSAGGRGEKEEARKSGKADREVRSRLRNCQAHLSCGHRAFSRFCGAPLPLILQKPLRRLTKPSQGRPKVLGAQAFINETANRVNGWLFHRGEKGMQQD